MIAAADAGAEVDHHDVGVLLRRTELPLGPRCGVGVVVDRDRHGHPPLEVGLEGLVAPRQVRREDDRRPVVGHEAGRADADGAHRRSTRASSSSATTSTMVSSTTTGLLERCGVSRRARPTTVPDSSTSPPATLVPPMSMPMASGALTPGPPGCPRRRSGCPGPGRCGAPSGGGVGPGVALRSPATSRRVAATADARSASRSTVSGRTERSRSIPWQSGQTWQLAARPTPWAAPHSGHGWAWSPPARRDPPLGVEPGPQPREVGSRRSARAAARRTSPSRLLPAAARRPAYPDRSAHPPSASSRRAASSATEPTGGAAAVVLVVNHAARPPRPGRSARAACRPARTRPRRRIVAEPPAATGSGGGHRRPRAARGHGAAG